MPTDREQRIRDAVARAINSVASGETELGPGGLFELAYPFVAADVPDTTHDEIQGAFASVWKIDRTAQDLYRHVLAICDRHNPRENESIRDILERAAFGGDLEAAYLLSLTANP